MKHTFSLIFCLVATTSQLSAAPLIVVEPVRFVAPIPEQTSRALCNGEYLCGSNASQSFKIPTKDGVRYSTLVVGNQLYPMLHPNDLATAFGNALTREGGYRVMTGGGLFGDPVGVDQAKYRVRATITEFALIGSSDELNLSGAFFGLAWISSKSEQGSLRIDFSVVDEEYGRYLAAFSVGSDFGSSSTLGSLFAYSSKTDRLKAINAAVQEVLAQGANRILKSL
ncbi:hypothetical protein JNK13_07615 [bacterium]|nr:hypothetical protein [bacterium]